MAGKEGMAFWLYVLLAVVNFALQEKIWEKIKDVDFHIFDRPKVRRILHGKYASGFILFLWGAVIAVTALAATLDNADYLFGYAYFFAAVAFIWSLGSWLTSETVQTRSRQSRRQRRGLDEYSWRKYVGVKWGVSLLIAILFAGSLKFVGGVALRKELQSLAGRLLPASDETPWGVCGRNLRDDEVALFLGRDDAIRTRVFPEVIIISKRFGPILSVDRSADGTIGILLDIRSKDGRIIVKFNRDGFVVNRNNILQMQRKDRSSLVILDEYGHEVINARYLNPHALNLTGTISYGDRQIPITLPELVGLCLDSNGFSGADVEIP